ncbi:hypothetical protein [Treponema ruminis]|uniref:Uncharacterized protein n=1 Tax=Treponema ruminis TaxID=744515 RepID=A0A7W8LM41_9SPIR|nr:hypothetical protein [Treponema ruminis]MBB5226126.1 hypothetical protein [Treponema ruminis]
MEVVVGFGDFFYKPGVTAGKRRSGFSGFRHSASFLRFAQKRLRRPYNP